MKVSETFLSIQGEGPMQGRPAFFIRLAGCNLRCSFCDTPYAQTAGEGELVTGVISEVRDQMLALAQANGPDFMFVFTGGEPLVQQAEIETLLGAYRARHFKKANAWFETNGTILPSKALVQRYHAQFVVSPKTQQFDIATLKALSNLGAHFKFVIDSKLAWDFDAAMKVAEKAEVPKLGIWMQPMADNKSALAKASVKLWEQCAKHGVGFSPRTHVWVHGKKRGV